MDYQELAATLTPAIIARFKLALEIGRWPDGRKLDDEQRQHCMQAVIFWEQQHLPENERVGYIEKGSKNRERTDSDSSARLRWTNSSIGKE